MTFISPVLSNISKIIGCQSVLDESKREMPDFNMKTEIDSDPRNMRQISPPVEDSSEVIDDQTLERELPVFVNLQNGVIESQKAFVENAEYVLGSIISRFRTYYRLYEVIITFFFFFGICNLLFL